MEDYEGATSGKKATTVDGGWKVYMEKAVSVTVAKAGSKPDWTKQDPNPDAEVLVGFNKSGIKVAVLTVVDGDGNVYYSETAKAKDTSSNLDINTGFRFYMYNTNNAWAEGATGKVTSVTSRAAAAGWYSYTVKVDGVVIYSGVFYYA